MRLEIVASSLKTAPMSAIDVVDGAGVVDHQRVGTRRPLLVSM